METNEKKGNTMDNPQDSGRLKGVAALLTAIAALIAAVAAINKPTDTEPTRKAYEALARDIRELSMQVNRNHADTRALRDYVDGYMRGRDGTRVDAGAPVDGGVGSGFGGFGPMPGLMGPPITEPPVGPDEVPPVGPPPKRIDPEPFNLTQRVLRTPSD